MTVASFKSGLHYEKFVEDALRSVVRRALEEIAKEGLPGHHHFYITFRTHFPDVEISPSLLNRHPFELTIVLQNQYWGLEVEQDYFEVTLSFNKQSERLHIPFAAVSAFSDPPAKFGLQFNMDSDVEQPTTVFVVDDESDDTHQRSLDGNSKPHIKAPWKRNPPDAESTGRAADTEGRAADTEGRAADTTGKAADTEGKVIALDAFRKK